MGTDKKKPTTKDSGKDSKNRNNSKTGNAGMKKETPKASTDSKTPAKKSK